MSKQISIGGGQGFWGDSNDAAIHMIRTAELDYMACRTPKPVTQETF